MVVVAYGFVMLAGTTYTHVELARQNGRASGA